jgi:hypothetical protein
VIINASFIFWGWGFMKKRVPFALAAAAAVATTVVVGQGAAGASTYEFVGWSGGSIVRAVNNTVTSALTAASSIEGPTIGAADSNSLAAASIPSLASLGAITTNASSGAIPGGVQVISHAKTTGVNLLNGLITANAVDTTAIAKFVNGVVTSDTSTTFVGLHIVGADLPVTIPKNFNVNIPGVVQIVLNASFTAKQGADVMTQGAGLYASLLKPQGQNAAGAAVYLNPTYAAIGAVDPVTNTSVGGYGYGTKVAANAGTLANVRSDPTAPISLAGGGTNGTTKTNAIGAVNLNSVLHIGAITTSATGTNDATVADARTTAEIAGINLFNGLITADAIKAVAHARRPAGGPTTTDRSTTFVNLTIAGKAIPVSVSPNTVINVANLGTVTINGQGVTSNATLVRVIDVKLSTADYGLPVGAHVEIGVAAAWVNS